MYRSLRVYYVAIPVNLDDNGLAINDNNDQWYTPLYIYIYIYIYIYNVSNCFYPILLFQLCLP